MKIVRYLRALSVRLLFLLNLPFSLLLLLSYLAPIIPPTSNSYLAILALGFPFLLLANFVWALFWLFRRKRLFYLPAICMLLGFPYFSQTYGLRFSAQRAAPAGFRLMSYNMRYFNTGLYRKEADLLREQNRFLAYLRKENPHILAAQECSGRGVASTQRFKDSLLQMGLSYQHLGGGSSLGIFSRYPLINLGQIRFEGSHNGAIFADIIGPKDTFRLYAVHLQSTRLGQDAGEVLKKENLKSLNDKKTQDTYYRIGSKLSNAFELRSIQAQAIVKHASASPHPVFILGDFNDTPLSYSYRLLAKGRKDSFIEQGSGLGASYAGGLPGLRIDYILLPKSCKVYNHRLQAEAISDHRAVISDCECL
ncbi:metal-dependent hydrolase [Saprospira grandis DSM 2844]|uniref:Metal-dependent hydrolase n=1 Tax=Saprospira grandis DSM 2844 TaxID=694433 RepID=J1I464_9BACT|nr:endonuclease/exonuclease/phosphatase family protein [Saprospira grandis]EJF53113.1 metal-dependent hydrolase [Saprospira grandis DSM 2844]